MQVSFIAVLFLGIALVQVNASYQVGMGIWDVTGPAAEVNMMGMGQAGQRTEGIHFRLRSRATIFADSEASTRLVYVTNNLCMTYGSLVQNVTAKLQAKYGDLYTHENVMISGEHTHSGPAGYTYMSLYDITSLGFHDANFQAIVDGIVAAISMAHDNLQPGRVFINNGTLLDASISRSEYSYDANPPSEKEKFEHNTDKEMTVLRFENSQGDELGLLSWFAVHGTSMNNTNRLISGDNKGYAAYYVEKLKNGNSPPGMGPFIAGFAQCNEGDVSPNTVGALCPDGTPCDPRSSTCINDKGEARTKGCIGVGPGKDMFDSTRIIGQKQADFALALFDDAVKELTGTLSYIHTYVDMENVTVSPQYTETGAEGRTCTAALGDSFAGGTTDGAGDFNFVQGTNSTATNPKWNEFAYTILSRPSQETMDCHYPKPILLNTGEMKFPAPWTASVVPIQIFRIGQLFVVAVPGEFTTMSGRRLRASIMHSLTKHGLADSNSHIVISGLSNEYTHYIATYQEYQIQRYESASTLYGPHTLAAYLQEYDKLVMGMVQNKTSLPGPTPPDLSDVKWCLAECDRLPDGHPEGEDFGSIETDVLPSYQAGETANVTFWGANPDHDFMTQSTYLTVDLNVNGQWQTVLVDGDWDTKLHWKREGVDHSLITVEWNIAPDTQPGKYRITHSGNAKKAITGRLHAYQGISSTFTVQA